MPFASIEFRFSIHPRMHAQLTKTPNIRSLFPMYALKHAYPLEWHLRGSWNMAPAVASHSRTGNRAYPNRKATDSPGHDRLPDTRWRNGFEWHPALAWLPDSELGCLSIRRAKAPKAIGIFHDSSTWRGPNRLDEISGNTSWTPVSRRLLTFGFGRTSARHARRARSRHHMHPKD